MFAQFTNDQFSAAANAYGKEFKAGFEAAFAAANSLAHTQFAGFEKLVELNVATAKAGFAASTEATKRALSAKDVQEFAAVQAELAQPAFEKSAAYVKGVYEIAASTNGAIIKEAEGHAAEAQKAFLATLDKATKQVPGSEPVAAAVKTAFASANSAYDFVAKAAKQAADMAEANVSTATKQAQATVKAAAKRK
jgi:phasin family protein